MEMKIVILGTGQQKYHELYTELAAKYPDRLGVRLEFNNKLDGSKVFAKVIPGQIKRTRGKYRFDFELQFPGGDE